ncbi:hypothetical protein SAMN05421663_104103 [Terribacillus halophilus]|uniref:Uncharacterized protein n=1 Tax=Terribacillus halophilus TaxID=361279 RepID=A0A1G6PGJ4_9BACI|nr:hypothetical protein [Terribacillus halophilus]SDC78567.1 hypothetical protein SAMN05421663_104103 [Terribacillus halophilus]
MTNSYEQTYPQSHQMMDMCKRHKNQYVLVQLMDGYQLDGIILDVDDEYVHLAIPADEQYDFVEDDDDHRNPYGYPGYGYGYGYGYPGGRFRRLVLPLVGLAALSLIPW